LLKQVRSIYFLNLSNFLGLGVPSMPTDFFPILEISFLRLDGVFGKEDFFEVGVAQPES
jgi:hypothetical protein